MSEPVSTTDDDHQEPDMTAATVESHTEPHRYPENPQAATPKVTGRPDPATELAPSDAFKARLRAMMRDVPHVPEEDEPVPSGLDDQRATVRSTAWRNSVEAAQLSDKAAWTLDKIESDLFPGALRSYVDSLAENMATAPRLNLVLAGRVGPGKTSAALAAGQYAVERGLLTRVVRHKHYLKWLQPEKAPAGLKSWQIERRFRDCDLLILDDLGSGLNSGEEATRHVRAETMSLLEDRMDSGKATLITTNEKSAVYRDVEGEQVLVGGIAHMLDPRVLSRLSERGAVLSCLGPDRRQPLSW